MIGKLIGGILFEWLSKDQDAAKTGEKLGI